MEKPRTRSQLNCSFTTMRDSRYHSHSWCNNPCTFQQSNKATGRRSATSTLSNKTLHPTHSHLLLLQKAEYVCRVSFIRAQGSGPRAARPGVAGCARALSVLHARSRCAAGTGAAGSPPRAVRAALGPSRAAGGQRSALARRPGPGPPPARPCPQRRGAQGRENGERAAPLSWTLPYRRRARPPRGRAPRWDRRHQAASRPRTAESSLPSAGCGCRGCRAGWSPSDPSPRRRRRAWHRDTAPPGRPRGSPGRRSPRGAAGAWRAVNSSNLTRPQPPLPTANNQPHPTEAERGPCDQGRGGDDSRVSQWHPFSGGVELSSESRGALAPPVALEEKRWDRRGHRAPRSWRGRGWARRGSSGVVRSGCCAAGPAVSRLGELASFLPWGVHWEPRGLELRDLAPFSLVKTKRGCHQCLQISKGQEWSGWDRAPFSSAQWQNKEQHKQTGT